MYVESLLLNTKNFNLCLLYAFSIRTDHKTQKGWHDWNMEHYTNGLYCDNNMVCIFFLIFKQGNKKIVQKNDFKPQWHATSEGKP